MNGPENLGPSTCWRALSYNPLVLIGLVARLVGSDHLRANICEHEHVYYLHV